MNLEKFSNPTENTEFPPTESSVENRTNTTFDNERLRDLIFQKTEATDDKPKQASWKRFKNKILTTFCAGIAIYAMNFDNVQTAKYALREYKESKLQTLVHEKQTSQEQYFKTICADIDPKIIQRENRKEQTNLTKDDYWKIMDICFEKETVKKILNNLESIQINHGLDELIIKNTMSLLKGDFNRTTQMEVAHVEPASSQKGKRMVLQNYALNALDIDMEAHSFLHELGHVLQPDNIEFWVKARQQTNKEIFPYPANLKVDETKKSKEDFAETFAVYHTNMAWLFKEDPIRFRAMSKFLFTQENKSNKDTFVQRHMAGNTALAEFLQSKHNL